jgi:hypothetical protein
MKRSLVLFPGVAVAWLLAGCTSVPPGVERGPHGTIAYNVSIQSSEPGVRIETNGAYAGTTPMTLKIFGDKDGTLHDFGSYFYVIQALPVHTNQFVQTRTYRTGRWFTPEDYVPRQIYLDMNRPESPMPPPLLNPPPFYDGPVYFYGPPPPYYYWPRRYWWW